MLKITTPAFYRSFGRSVTLYRSFGISRFYSNVTRPIKLPINSIEPVSAENVCATGVDSIILNLPKRNETEELFDKSKEMYLKMRNLLLPQYEGMWLLASVQPLVFHLTTHEAALRFLKSGLSLDTAYYDCLGREILLYFDAEDLDEIPSAVDEEGVTYPKFDKNVGNHLWKDALWLPARYWNNKLSCWYPYFMKLDTGAARVGVPSNVFIQGGIKAGKEKMVYGVSGACFKRIALDVKVEHKGKVIVLPEVFEHNKFLLGYDFCKHFVITINWKSPPFDCQPVE